MSLRIAVFGTSRSGKDYTIRDATELLSEKGMLFTHVSPISMIHKGLNDRKLRDMPEDEKHTLVKSIRERIDNLLEDDYVFIDEHYCFPRTFDGRVIDNDYYGEKLPYFEDRGFEGRIYETVFDENWLKKYDAAVYMDIDPHIILNRFQTSDGIKNNPFATYDDVYLWQMFEIDRIQEMCIRNSIPLYYIYDHQRSGEELTTIVLLLLQSNNNRKAHSEDYTWN